jgi:hypothetical protein
MSVRFTYPAEFPCQPLLDSELADCEEFLGVTLPAELRLFLQAHDGPMPNPAWIRVEGDGEPKWLGPVGTFFTVMRTDPRSRRDTIESYTYSGREIQKLPRHFLSIGIALCQPSTLLLSTAEKDYGAIYAWQPRFRRFKPGQIVKIALGLSELLDAFCEPPTTVEEFYPNWQSDLARIRSTPAFPT